VYSTKELQQLHAAGKAHKLPSGAVVPTSNPQEVSAAIAQAKAAHRTGGDDDDPGLRSHLIGRAAANGLQRLIPASWAAGAAGKSADPLDGLTELEAIMATRVDLVASPANGAPLLIMKSKAGQQRPISRNVAQGVAGAVVKADSSQRYTLCLAYPADKPDVAVAADGHRDFIGKAALEEAAWEYLTKSPNIGLWHEDGTDGAGQVVESYIYRGPDWTIAATDGTEQVIKSGDWLLGIRWSPDTWPLVRDGHGRGVSMQGSAKRRAPSTEAVAALTKAEQLERRASVLSDPAHAGRLREMAKSVREGLMTPAQHLAKAAEYTARADRMTSPADRRGYLDLAAQERQKAGM
jgi:hypothetical protein